MARKSSKNKIEETKLTPEEIKVKEEDSIIKSNKYIPEPTYRFNVGDEVLCGNYSNVRIAEVKYDGKFYWIEMDSRDRAGNVTGRQDRFVSWLQVRKCTGRKDFEYAKRNPLNLSYNKEMLEGQLHKIYDWGVDFSPEYQREYVWDLEDKVDLIDSIMKNLDIGKFVYVFRGYGAENEFYEILDGKQRLTAIKEFYEDRFMYKGKYFSDLSRRDQDTFLDRIVDVAEVEGVTLKQKMEYFIRLNTKGRVMDKEHLAMVEEKIKEMEN